ncbi:MAG: response regulator transcription factor [Actinomycetota bacterium]
MPRIPVVLVVDDEAPIREVVRRYLVADGYQVVEAADGESALEQFDAHAPDVVVLDVMMPGVDGLEVLRRIRTRSDAYVVMVTARTEEMDRLIGLSVGADDYISKPFSPRELVARVKALQRRPRIATTNSSTTRFGELVIDTERREVLLADQPVELSALEFDMLATLTGAPGRVFSRRQLIDRVWGPDFYGDDRVVDVHIRNLRRALGDDAGAPRWVGTVRGVGYKSLVEPS